MTSQSALFPTPLFLHARFNSCPSQLHFRARHCPYPFVHSGASLSISVSMFMPASASVFMLASVSGSVFDIRCPPFRPASCHFACRFLAPLLVEGLWLMLGTAFEGYVEVFIRFLVTSTSLPSNGCPPFGDVALCVAVV
jgi:hypothetical protein